jgi:localization factor PodJL
MMRFSRDPQDTDEPNQMSQRQIKPEIFEPRLREIEARIEALQNSIRHDDIAEILRQQLAEFRDLLKEAPRVEEIARTWRDDLEAVSATLRDAVSVSVTAALEGRIGGERQHEGALVPASFNAGIRALADRLDAVRISATGLAALEGLERRIGALVEKLAGFEAQWQCRVGADRRIDALLEQLRELRAENEGRLAAIQQQIATIAADVAVNPAECIRRDVASLKEIQTSVDRRTQDTFEAVYGTIEQVVDRLGIIENELRSPPQRPATTARLRHPAVPELDRDAPLDSGPSARRLRVEAQVDRIAASEDGEGVAKPVETAESVRAKFVSAARRAAQASVGELQAALPAANPPAHAGECRKGEKPRQDAARTFALGTLFQAPRPRERQRPQAKLVMLGVSMVLLVLAVLSVALDLFRVPAGQHSVVVGPEEAAAPGGEPAHLEQPPTRQPPPRPGANLEGRALPAPAGSANALADETMRAQALPWGIPSAMAASATPTVAATPPPYLALLPPLGREGLWNYPPRFAREVQEAEAFSPLRNQGTSGHDRAPQYDAPATPDLMATSLPPTIGGKALLAGASAGDPSACYEIAIRLAQGRNTTRDLAKAAAWFERAARGGLVPAQFRLAVMYEKGLGVTKDLMEARRLYVAAAAKGHAKAMHNLAVLYAGGVDGMPDYGLASQWFRKAAGHGVVDSQYDLAILYARGLGVEGNFAESYKWFALAAKGGDKDAARKRDEVAERLDAKQLESAKLNVESFVAVPQPDEATAINVPAGGWDQAVTTATTKSKALVRPERFIGK